MDDFTEIVPFLVALLPIALLSCIYFYRLYRRTCKIIGLVLMVLSAFIFVFSALVLVGIYEVISGAALMILIVAVISIFVIGGGAFVGVLVRSNSAAEQFTKKEGE